MINGLSIEERTNDLLISIEGDDYIRSFVSDPTDEEVWYISDWDNNIRLVTSPKSLSVIDIEGHASS